MSKRRTKPKASAEPQNHLTLREIKPLTTNQSIAFSEYEEGQNLFLYGWPGVGKTMVALYLALKEVIEERTYEKVIIVRSVLPSKDLGFMPGNLAEKSGYYEAPYIELVGDLFGRGDAYSILKQKDIIRFTTTSFLRGTTFKDAIVIVDECQNLEKNEWIVSMSRMGNNTKLIMCGDLMQTDLKERDQKHLAYMVKVLRSMKSVSFIEFDKQDIVRSGFCKEFIISLMENKDSFA